MKVCQLCPTLCGPGEWIVHGILQARILEWVAFPFCRGSSQPRDWTQASHIEGRFFYQLSHKGSPAVRWRGLGKLKDLTSSPQALKKDLRAESRRGPRQTRRRSLRLSLGVWVDIRMGSAPPTVSALNLAAAMSGIWLSPCHLTFTRMLSLDYLLLLASGICLGPASDIPLALLSCPSLAPGSKDGLAGTLVVL